MSEQKNNPFPMVELAGEEVAVMVVDMQARPETAGAGVMWMPGLILISDRLLPEQIAEAAVRVTKLYLLERAMRDELEKRKQLAQTLSRFATEIPTRKGTRRRCPLCSAKCGTIGNLHAHLLRVHVKN